MAQEQVFKSASEKKTFRTLSGEFYEADINEYWDWAIQKGKEREPNFVLDDNFKKLARALCLYFWEDERFETEGYGSLQKGLFITGNVGVGKTFLIRLFTDNPRKRYTAINTNKVCSEYQKAGIELLEPYYQHIGSGSGYSSHGGKQFTSYFFDDLGNERTLVNHMGNPINVMETVILGRYANDCPHYHTHFTSNLDGNQIEELYGTRVRSRLREMVNFIEMDGSDRRK